MAKKTYIWQIQKSTETFRKFIQQCLKLNFQKSLQEERVRYSRSPFFFRQHRGYPSEEA